jgi:hypothetical protein
MPEDIDGAITRWRKTCSAAGRNGLIMRPANAARRCAVALPPSRRATAQDGSPDDDQFQVRKAAAFACGLWPGGLPGHILRTSSRTCEAPLESTVGEIVACVIGTRATLLRIAQGRPQPCDPPGWNDLKGCSVHCFSPLNPLAPTMQGPKWLNPVCRSTADGIQRSSTNGFVISGRHLQ